MSGYQNDKYKFSIKSPVSVAMDDVIEKRAEEIENLKEELLTYKILIKDLAHEDPSYSIRNKILNIAYFIIEDVELFDYLSSTKKFPINRLLNRTPVEKEFFQTWKEYIIAYVVIFSNPNYKYLQEYIQVVESINILGVDEVSQVMQISEHRGLILNKGLRSAIILTSKGEFIKVKSGKDNKIGEDIISTEGITLRKYKLQISILLSLLIVIITIGVFKYKAIDKTIVIETTSSITLEVNKFNRIIDSYSKTEKGASMLKELKVDNDDIDNSIKNILDYAFNNGMIPENGVLITVTGEPLRYNALNKTEEFIKEQEIQVRLNNSGDEHKVSP
ncbi:anti-sigma factor domain-containing protein [Clostridium sp. DSM 100503]|uniref:anti-sigma factor domain-containing protein n=1 Tax=Clostridium sp. DSM 100503 TaxID=2963282 RepID=UPI002149D3F7|nr:anti-sigma factor domain-containing protein [Clostridium sp. DSM 100503]MCR1950497.1 anti-sigma factor domain-containing protein [Clostridium sp. DSM 100503]